MSAQGSVSVSRMTQSGLRSIFNFTLSRSLFRSLPSIHKTPNSKCNTPPNHLLHSTHPPIPTVNDVCMRGRRWRAKLYTIPNKPAGPCFWWRSDPSSFQRSRVVFIFSIANKCWCSILSQYAKPLSPFQEKGTRQGKGTTKKEDRSSYTLLGF